MCFQEQVPREAELSRGQWAFELAQATGTLKGGGPDQRPPELCRAMLRGMDAQRRCEGRPMCAPVTADLENGRAV